MGFFLVGWLYNIMSVLKILIVYFKLWIIEFVWYSLIKEYKMGKD